MGKRVRKQWCNSGGILSLVQIVEKNDRALEYDLMTRTGRTLDEYLQMGASGRLALISFINNLPPDSALYRADNPKDEVGEWFTTLKTNVILADIFDAFIAAHTKKGTKPKAYPRPKQNQSIGKDAIPVSQFWDWWHEQEKG